VESEMSTRVGEYSITPNMTCMVRSIPLVHERNSKKFLTHVMHA
jgi:hypothetical protein